jgi:hypothetical protein
MEHAIYIMYCFNSILLKLVLTGSQHVVASMLFVLFKSLQFSLTNQSTNKWFHRNEQNDCMHDSGYYYCSVSLAFAHLSVVTVMGHQRKR